MRIISNTLLTLALCAALVSCGRPGSSSTGGVPPGALEITVLYGSEKQAWMEMVVKQFNDQGVKSSTGKPIYVTATPLGSNESLTQILSGQAQPTVWSPASSILIPLANEQWARNHNGEKLIPETPPALVLSPVVIAMWEPMAKALGWPDIKLGWSDIAELASSGKTWKDYGHPEWGPFQFGHTHPDYSNSGIVSVLAEIYAATGKTRGLTLADVQRPATAAFVKAVESGVIHYGESTGFFADQLFNRGPGYLSAAVLYENLVVQSRDRTKYPNVALPVAALYPKEGTFWSDHPYAILNTPWVDAEQRAAAMTFRDFLLAKPQQELALQLGFRPGDPNIPIGAPIDAAHGVDPRQPQTLLEVPNAEVITAARAVWGQNKKRVDVMVVLDVSGSMTEENRLERAKTALRTFIQQLADEDGLGLTVFSSQATVLSPISPLGTKRQQLLDQVGGLIPQGGTRLFDTIREAYAPLSAEPSGQRIRALVVLTDGEDNESRLTADDLVRQLQQNEEGQSIKVFTIAYSGGAQGSVDALKRIAQASGAKSYTPDIPIDQVYRDIGTFF
jgi:Ca-activated chloride channel family protein